MEETAAITQFFDALNTDAGLISAAVIALGVVIIGVKMAEKGINVASRNIRKV